MIFSWIIEGKKAEIYKENLDYDTGSSVVWSACLMSFQYIVFVSTFPEIDIDSDGAVKVGAVGMLLLLFLFLLLLLLLSLPLLP